MSLIEKIDSEVKAVETNTVATATVLFDKAKVDIREELPGLMAKLGINTNDEKAVIHAALVLVIQLLEKYGPAEIRDILAGV